jgi:hypothetical protein
MWLARQYVTGEIDGAQALIAKVRLIDLQRRRYAADYIGNL